MAKIQDKLYNRVIEGKLLELSEEDLKALKDNGINQTPSYELGDVEDIENVIDSLRVGDTLSITGTLYVVTYIDSSQVNLLQLDGLGSLELDYLTYDIGSKDLSTDTYHLATQNDMGTKLYKHSVLLSDNRTFTVITNNNIPFTVNNSLSVALDTLFENYCIVEIKTNALSQMIYDYDNSKLYYIANGLQSLAVNNLNVVSDTVTPL